MDLNIQGRKMPWREKSQPTPASLPGKFQGQRSQVGYSPWGCKESDMTEYTRHRGWEGGRGQGAFRSFWFLKLMDEGLWKKMEFWSTSVQLLSCVQHFATPWIVAHQASLSITNSRSLLKLMSIKLVMPSNHLILSSASPSAFNLSQHQGLFKWVSSSHQLAQVPEFQL